MKKTRCADWMLCLSWPCKRSLMHWLDLDGVWGLRLWCYLAPMLFPVRLLYCVKFSLFTYIGLYFVSEQFSGGVALPWTAWLSLAFVISTIALLVSATQWLEELFDPPKEERE